MSNLADLEYSIIDFKNQPSLSSYALKETPLTFIPNVENFFYIRTLWDFGDDTYSTALTAKKYYEKPGRYVTNLTIYDCFSNAIVSRTSKIVDIKDFLPFTFNVNFENPTYNNSITWKAGKIEGPIIFNAFYPSNVEKSDIYYRVYGSDSQYFFQDDKDKFIHLRNNYSIYNKKFNYKKSSDEFVASDKIVIDTTPIYAKIQNNSIVIANSTDEDSFYVGLSGTSKVYFKNDTVDNVRLKFFFDKRNNEIYNNNLAIELSANIVVNNEIDRFSITSNGIDGEFYPSNSFELDDTKFNNVEIPFVIKVKDSEDYTVKNIRSLSSTNFNFVVLSSNAVVPPMYYTVRNIEDFDGSTRKSIIFRSDYKINDVKITISGSVSSINGSVFNIEGASSVFDVYPQDFIAITKKNEDFDATEMFKGLRFQEFLFDKEVLFDDFIGSIFGNIDSSYDTLGKKIYEKITNFVENTQDVDRNELTSLISQMKMMGVTPDNIYDSLIATYPSKIKRIMDIASLSDNKLLGFKNKFNQNFDLKGYSTRETYGINLGDQINTDTYVISAGIPIVALEKFSNEYVLLNTLQPVEDTNTNYYKLSDYNENWGWGLVLPSEYNYNDIKKFYLFFEYNDVFDNTLYGNTVLDNTKVFLNMLDLEYAIKDENNNPILDEDGFAIAAEYEVPEYRRFLIDVLFRDTLYQSLSLVK
jgi:hypothetical protein